MSILDDAIREHLELKRAHGADDHELKKLEDEAFGPPQRPDQIDPFAEAPTEFLLAPTEIAADAPAIEDDSERSGRRPNLTDLQEAPPAEAPFDVDAPAPAVDELAPTPDAPPPSPTDAADVPPPPPPGEAPADLEERHAIADQPTQMFDVQAEMAAEVPAPTEQESPSDQELVDAVQGEPQAAPPAPEEPVLASDEAPEDPAAAVGPPTEIHEQPPLEIRGPDAELAGQPPAEAVPEAESAEYDFFNEQRLSDELDQALEAPITEERDLPAYGDAPAAQGAIFDFESSGSYEEDPSEEALRRADAVAEQPAEEAPRPAPEPPSEELGPPSEEAPRDFVEQPSEELEQPSEEAARPAAEPPSEEAPYFDPDTGHEDVLEDRPQFLESEDDDDLWFEQKPPKDFDLD
jgi:hypothetical protein